MAAIHGSQLLAALRALSFVPDKTLGGWPPLADDLPGVEVVVLWMLPGAVSACDRLLQIWVRFH